MHEAPQNNWPCRIPSSTALYGSICLLTQQTDGRTQIKDVQSSSGRKTILVQRVTLTIFMADLMNVQLN